MDVIDAIILGLIILIAKIACRGAAQAKKWGKRKGPRKDEHYDDY